MRNRVKSCFEYVQCVENRALSTCRVKLCFEYVQSVQKSCFEYVQCSKSCLSRAQSYFYYNTQSHRLNQSFYKYNTFYTTEVGRLYFLGSPSTQNRLLLKSCVKTKLLQSTLIDGR